MISKKDALTKNLLYEKVAVIHAAFEDVPTTVAFVEVEKAFVKTNSIDDAWWNNTEITKMFDGVSCRSTSVGDMVLIGNRKYKCENAGWSEMS